MCVLRDIWNYDCEDKENKFGGRMKLKFRIRRVEFGDADMSKIPLMRRRYEVLAISDGEECQHRKQIDITGVNNFYITYTRQRGEHVEFDEGIQDDLTKYMEIREQRKQMWIQRNK